MTPFLKQVADHYYNEGKIEGSCFIFPNRRSMVFFKKYLGETVSASADKPIVVPKMLTVSDFFSAAVTSKVADRVTLLLSLYDCYRKLMPAAESLDEFIFWGDVILGDFNDVDKYLADPKQIFANIADYKSLQDTFEYLTDTQRKAIESFAGHFVEKSPRKSDNPDARDVSRSFLQIWNILYPLYLEFNKVLEDKGLAYEGMVYRRLATSLDPMSLSDILSDAFGASLYVFVGLNALNACEKLVMSRIQDAGIAEFCWDYPGKMISDPLNRSSFFMSDNVRQFKPAFDVQQEDVGMPEFNVLSVPSSYGQVKHVPGILSRTGLGQSESDCAIIIPDEGLLMPLLNSIPPYVRDINVTMGYPMSASEMWSLMTDIMKMQLHVSSKKGQCRYYHKNVWDIFSNALFKRLVGGDDMEECRARMEQIKLQARYYIPQEQLSGFPLFDVIFRPVITDMASASASQIRALASYQQEVLSYIAPVLARDLDSALEVDFAKEYWCAVNRLKEKELEILPVTYLKLLDSLLSAVAVPFAGEPLKGLQIMGPLETRALDFRNVIILSCNEGTFPGRNVSSSFVPPELRRGFGLPTYEYQDSVWAYYFYRLIARAENVWLLYDSRTEGLKSGEESRYIKQLRYHFHVPVNEYVSDAGLAVPVEKSVAIEKTQEMMDKMKSKAISPSALQNYVDCPMRFYYASVAGLKKDKEVEESLTASMIGNVYHNTMWALFVSEEQMMSDKVYDKREKKPDFKGHVTKEYLNSWIDREKDVRRKVESLVMSELGTDEIAGRNLVIVSVIVRYVLETLKRDVELLDAHGAQYFDVIGLEMPVSAEMNGLKFYGIADRVDRIGEGNVRLVDYKSGKDDPSVLMTSGNDSSGVADVVFGSDYTKRKDVKAALQFFIYDKMLEKSGVTTLEHVCNSMYATAKLFSDKPMVCPLDKEFAEEMDKRLVMLLDEILNVDVPFRMATDSKACEWCDFKMICGR